MTARRPETYGHIPIKFNYVARRCIMSQDRPVWAKRT
jgi:hypothetical protein